MKWFAIVSVLILLIVSVRFRKFALSVTMLLVFCGLMVWVYQEYEAHQVRNRILPPELRLENVSFAPLNNDYEMTGRIFNGSEKHPLNGLQLKLSVKECNDHEELNCIIFYETEEYVYIMVPPRQARDFKKVITLYSNQAIKGRLVWNYSIVYADSH
ncbi:hypothetical protein ABF87_10180 [Nitrosomonas sp. JL21]|nr:hypothetical protein [Nitrosomonas sp.]MCC7092140.1 hypothetical protein [Nitrosomonas sp.]MXS78319.1 hypothetical protein [Nitrosomonas sp. JL21]